MLGPDWNELYQIASAQDGYFTAAQGREAGYSKQLLIKYVRNGRVRKARRGIYRLVHFPSGEREDLTVLWLWSGEAGTFSNVTALSLHGLSDVLPARVHMTVPASWARRRLVVPEGLELHYAELAEDERVWIGPVRATSVRRTLLDCVAEHVSPEIVRQALREAVDRGLVSRSEVSAAEQAMVPYGGSRR